MGGVACRGAGWRRGSTSTTSSSARKAATHGEDNLIVLCESHHSAIHDGRLILEGTAAAPRFLHADGTSYGADTAPSRNDAFADVLLALKTMGCKEAIARKAIARVQPVGQELPVEDRLRRCLVVMRQV
jgi:hypothetical protein